MEGFNFLKRLGIEYTSEPEPKYNTVKIFPDIEEPVKERKEVRTYTECKYKASNEWCRWHKRYCGYVNSKQCPYKKPYANPKFNI